MASPTQWTWVCSGGLRLFGGGESAADSSLITIMFMSMPLAERVLGAGGASEPGLGARPHTKGHCHPRASSAKTRGFHTQLDEGPETP